MFERYRRGGREDSTLFLLLTPHFLRQITNQFFSVLSLHCIDIFVHSLCIYQLFFYKIANIRKIK